MSRLFRFGARRRIVRELVEESEPWVPAEIDNLNDNLLTLAMLYPQHDAAILREALCEAQPTTGEARLERAAYALTSVDGKGRPAAMLEPWELFRSPSYKHAVTKTLYGPLR